MVEFRTYIDGEDLVSNEHDAIFQATRTVVECFNDAFNRYDADAVAAKPVYIKG